MEITSCLPDFPLCLAFKASRHRGLIRGSSLSYRSRFCGSRDPYDSDEFEYDYHFDSKPSYSRVNASLQQDEEDKRVGKRNSKSYPAGAYHTSATPGDPGQFPVAGDFMEVDSTQLMNYGEPGEKRRKGDPPRNIILNKTLTSVLSEDGLFNQTNRDSSYDNTNNNNSTDLAHSSGNRLPSKKEKMTTAPTLPSPMSDGLPDFGTIINTVTAVRNKSSPHGSTSGVSSSSSSQSSTLAKQDPTAIPKKKDDWLEIANLMKSVGSSLNKNPVYAQEFEETFYKIMTGSELPRRVGTWLSDLGLPHYEDTIVGNGFDDISFLAAGILEEQDLIDMNIQNSTHRRRMLDSAKNLPKIKPLASYGAEGKKYPSTVKEWLESIALGEHEPTFLKMGYNTMEKVTKLRDTEIAAIIPLLGHRKRIRASIGPMQNSKSRTTSLSSSKVKVKSSPPLPRSPLLDTVDFFKDYSQSIGKSTANSTLNAYGTASSNSSALTNYSSLSDQVVPVAIKEEPEPPIIPRNPPKTLPLNEQNRSKFEEKHIKKDNFEQYFEKSKQEEDLLTLAITQLTEANNKNSQKHNKENMTTSEPNEIRVPDARRASYLSTSGELVLRPPNETTEEGVNVSAWCHEPEVLIRSCCNYQAYYLGSMLVHEVKGVESTVEACAKMKKSTDSMKKIPTVTLSISYKGVKFIDSKSKHEIAEHEIHNISFASQDADDLSTLAYITRDARTDHHYCHVFRVMTLDVAYEIILTLGQAFEIAYQLILKEKALKEGSA